MTPHCQSQTRRHRATVFAMILVAITTACASPDVDRSPTAAYRCDNGVRFTVRFDPQSALVQWTDSRRVTIAQQRAASGMWYATNGYELRGKGNEVTWSEPGAVPTQCKAI